MSRAPAAAALLLAGAALACQGPAVPADLGAARAQHARLRARLQELAAKDPVVQEAVALPASAIVGMRTSLVQELVDVVARRYLDQVDLDLALEAQVRESRDVTVDTFVGPVQAGTWTLDLVVHRVRGRLATGRPDTAPGADNRIRVAFPLALERGRGEATARFSWDGRAVGALVCRDFTVTRRLEGVVLPDEYPVEGAFQLEAGPSAVRARPVFPSRTFRIRVDLSAPSWTAVREILADQDRLTRCGLALDPEALLARLRTLLARGFRVTLPDSLFRPVDLPGAVRGTVVVQGVSVDLAVETRGLRVTPRAVWYAADVRSRVPPSAAAAAGLR